MLKFIKQNPAIYAALKGRQWATFARLYNGPFDFGYTFDAGLLDIEVEHPLNEVYTYRLIREDAPAGWINPPAQTSSIFAGITPGTYRVEATSPSSWPKLKKIVIAEEL